MQPRGGHLAADNGNFSELYQPNDANEFGSNRPYDGLDRLREFRRGILSDDKKSVATASRSQSWQLGALGNWASNTLDGTAQARSHNPANEITDLSDTASDPNYDSR